MKKEESVSSEDVKILDLIPGGLQTSAPILQRTDGSQLLTSLIPETTKINAAEAIKIITTLNKLIISIHNP